MNHFVDEGHSLCYTRMDVEMSHRLDLGLELVSCMAPCRPIRHAVTTSLETIHDKRLSFQPRLRIFFSCLVDAIFLAEWFHLFAVVHRQRQTQSFVSFMVSQRSSMPIELLDCTSNATSLARASKDSSNAKPVHLSVRETIRHG